MGIAIFYTYLTLLTLIAILAQIMFIRTKAQYISDQNAEKIARYAGDTAYTAGFKAGQEYAKNAITVIYKGDDR
jgi:hypothetical protein